MLQANYFETKKLACLKFFLSSSFS